MKMIRWYAGIAAAALLLALTSFSGRINDEARDRKKDMLNNPDDVPPRPVSIGFIGPLTGLLADYGTSLSQAALLAVRQRNAAGGLYGGREVQLVIEDSEGDPYRGEMAMRKLLQVNRISALVGCMVSSVTTQVSPLAEEEKVVMISPASTLPGLTRDNPYLFRTIIEDGQQAAVLAGYIRHELKLERAAILSVPGHYSSLLSDTFGRTFRAQGGSVTAHEILRSDSYNFIEPLMAIKQSRPQALFLPNSPETIIGILQIARQIMPEVIFLCGDSFSAPGVIEKAGADGRGVIFTASTELTGKKGEQQKAFEKAYFKEYKEEPIPLALNSYDAANLLMDALDFVLKKEGSLQNPELIRQYIASVNGYEGAGGPLGFYPDGNVIKTTGIYEAAPGGLRYIGGYFVDRENTLQQFGSD